MERIERVADFLEDVVDGVKGAIGGAFAGLVISLPVSYCIYNIFSDYFARKGVSIENVFIDSGAACAVLFGLAGFVQEFMEARTKTRIEREGLGSYCNRTNCENNQGYECTVEDCQKEEDYCPCFEKRR